jgi:AraC-like DNA-binding protein
MDIIWSQPKIIALLQNFHTIVNVRVGFFDLEWNELSAYPNTRSDFCCLVRAHDNGNSACINCDRAAFQHVSKYQKAYTYQCHAGLTEIIAPIMSSDDKPAAYLMVGQMRLLNDDKQHWESVCANVKPFNVNLRKLKTAYDALPKLQAAEMHACANILQALANYMWLDNYIRVQREPLSFKLKKYITENIDHVLFLPLLSRKMGVGKTTLCKFCRQDFGMTVNELIRSTRIEQAKKLLQSGDLPIAYIAEKVGILDYNYFTKVIKDETGIAPSTFRKLCKDDHLYAANRKTAPETPVGML